jgi:epoxide hydrolase-like predicted phosphatase
MIKAVLFDYGGVLTEAGKADGIAQLLGRLYDVDPKSVEAKDLHYQLLRSEIDEGQYFDVLNKRYGKQVSAQDWLLEAEREGFFKRCQPVYDVAAALRRAGIRTGILSNIYAMSAKALREQGIYNGFDPVVLSHEERLAKPEPEFFEAALKKLGVPGNEVLFIDDQERFRPVAESLGMRFIVSVSPRQVVQDVKDLILKENNLRLDQT